MWEVLRHKPEQVEKTESSDDTHAPGDDGCSTVKNLIMSELDPFCAMMIGP
jgi:hypothetical protein